jgi:hypothetical protein
MKRRWFCRVEWKPQDCWIGAFWKRGDLRWPKVGYTTFDVWICFIPMLPIHFGYVVAGR